MTFLGSHGPPGYYSIARRSELVPAGRYRDWVGGDTQIFQLGTKD